MKYTTETYSLTLLDFNNLFIDSYTFNFTCPRLAIARAGELLWEIKDCARVIIESEWGFQVTVEWGARRHY